MYFHVAGEVLLF